MLPEGDPVDLTRFQHVGFEVFAPTSGLRADVAFNAPLARAQQRGAEASPRVEHRPL